MPFFCFLTVWPHGVEPSNVRLLVFLFCLLVLRLVAESLVHWHTWKLVVWPVNLPKSPTSYRNPNTVPQGYNLMVKGMVIFSFIKVYLSFGFFLTFFRCRSPQSTLWEYYLLPQKAPWNGLHPLWQRRLARCALDALHASQNWVLYYLILMNLILHIKEQNSLMCGASGRRIKPLVRDVFHTSEVACGFSERLAGRCWRETSAQWSWASQQHPSSSQGRASVFQLLIPERCSTRWGQQHS